MVNPDSDLQVGDLVLVPWGLEEVEGEIIEIYSTGIGPRARVTLKGEFNEDTIVMPLDSLMRKRTPRSGNYGPAADYENRVGTALKRLLRAIGANAAYIIPSSDRVADFELFVDHHRILAEAKYFSAKGRVATDTVLAVAGLADDVTGALLISNVPLTPPAHERLDRLWRMHTRARFVQWRNQNDDAQLRAALLMFT